MAKFSVVMAVYNKLPFLPRSIQSVMSQTCAEFELLCVDGSSTDGSWEYLVEESKKDPRIKAYQQINQGISAAKNKGINLSKSNLIAFIDADDEWGPQFLSEIEYLSSKYPDAVGYVTAYKCNFGNFEKIVKIPKKLNDGIIDNYFDSRILGWGVHTSSVCIKTSVLKKVGLFPILTSSMAEDKMYVMDGLGRVIKEIKGAAFDVFFRKIDFSEINLSGLKPLQSDLKIEVPGPGAEDQYTHDLVALTGKYAYSNKVLSTWNGNIPGQDTKRKHSPIFFPAIGLYDNNIISPNKIINYLRYITIHVMDEIYNTKNINIINSHYFDKIWCSNHFLSKFYGLIYKWFFRFNKLFNGYMK